MDVAEVTEIFDLGEGVGGAVAEDEIGGFGIGGDEFAVGGDVENVGFVEESGGEAIEGEVLVEPLLSGEDAFFRIVGRLDDGVEFGGDEGEWAEWAGGVGEGDGVGESEAEDGGCFREFVGGVGDAGSEDIGDAVLFN